MKQRSDNVSNNGGDVLEYRNEASRPAVYDDLDPFGHEENHQV